MRMNQRLLVLAEQTAEQGKHSLTYKRRAVSTAYYALFHTLARLCAHQVVGKESHSKNDDDFTRAYRALDHGSLKKAFNEEPLKSNSRLQVIGIAAIRLQSERIRSDYLPSKRIYTYEQAKALIEEARLAMERIEKLGPQDRRTLAVNLLFKNR